MTIVLPPAPRRDDYFQAKPKRIHLSPNWFDRTGKGNTEPYRSNLLEFRCRIEQGHELPPRFYRNHIGKNVDELLDATGVKHIHLGTTKDDVLLFVQEFDDFIVLLEIADHKANFNQIPIGKVLLANQIRPLQTYLPGFLAMAQTAFAEKLSQGQRHAALAAARAAARAKPKKPPET